MMGNLSIWKYAIIGVVIWVGGGRAEARSTWVVSAWQDDGQLTQSLPVLGETIRSFFLEKRPQPSSSISRFDGTVSWPLLVEHLLRLSEEAQVSGDAETTLVLSFSTHGWPYKGLLYMRIAGATEMGAATEACIDQQDSDEDVARNCGWLSAHLLEELLEALSFQKILVFTNACYGGLLVENFEDRERVTPFRNQVAVFVANTKDLPVLAGRFESAFTLAFTELKTSLAPVDFDQLFLTISHYNNISGGLFMVPPHSARRFFSRTFNPQAPVR